MDSLARIWTGWIAACIGGGLVAVLPNWPPESDLESAFVVLGMVLLIAGVMGIIAEIVTWWRKRGKKDRDSAIVFEREVNQVNIVQGGEIGTATTAAAIPQPTKASGRGRPSVMYDRPWLEPESFHSGTLEGVSLRLTDLIPRDSNGIIAGKTFTNCTIYGPAVVIPQRCYFGERTVFGAFDRDVETILFTVPLERVSHAVVGPILLTHCRFHHCEFAGVGFMGSKELIEELRVGLIGREA